jgi:GTP-binding protein Era
MVFVDTPGFLKSKNALGDYMLKNIDSAVTDVDAILLAIDGHDGIDDKELQQIEMYGKKGLPLVVAVTKMDITQPEKLVPHLAKLNEYSCISEVFCVSSHKNKGMQELKTALTKYLTGTEMFFEEDDVTDKSQRYLVQEIIREKILLALDEEIPHGVGIELNKMQWNEEDNRWEIDANVIIEKQSHKPIILGKRGEMIKAIGTAARQSIQKMLDQRVYLELWVKVKEDWRNNKYVMTELGYFTK